MASVFDGVPALSHMDVGPGIDAYVQGRSQVRQDKAMDMQRAQEVSAIVTRGAQSADTPEKWGQFVGILQKRFPDADLSTFTDFATRQSMLDQARDPYKDAELAISRENLALNKAKAAKTEDGGPYAGNALDAQNWNIILKGDPAAPEYAAAYSQLFQTPRLVNGSNDQGQMITVPVYQQPPATVRPPGSAAPAPTSSATPAAGAPATAVASGGPVSPPTQAPASSGGNGLTVGAPVVTGTPKPSDAQRTASLFTTRAIEANKIIDEFEQQGIDWVEMTKNNVPLYGNGIISGPYRQLLQAERDFVNAVLRPESGAVISQPEFDNARQQYFPQPGDDPATIAQKNKSRQTEIDGLKVKAGPTYKAPPVQIKSDADFDKLPSGAEFIGPDGQLRRKP